MPTKAQQATGRMLAAKLLDAHIPADSPAWEPVRAMLTGGEEAPVKEKTKRKPALRVYHQLGRPVGTAQKQRMQRRRKELYPEMIERGLSNADMSAELNVSRSVVSYDLQRLGLHAHHRMRWRVTNTTTQEVRYYSSVEELHGMTHIRITLDAATTREAFGPWLIEHGYWFKDSKGNWREVPENA